MEVVYVYRKDSLNGLMCVSKEHYETYKDRFVLKEVEVAEAVVEIEVVVEKKPVQKRKLKIEKV